MIKRQKRKPRKQRKPRLSKKDFLLKCAAELNENLPASERWFWQEYAEAGLIHPMDVANEPLLGTIPDVVNRPLKYVIEVHDPTHLKKIRADNDARKELKWKKAGYAVFVVWAWQEGSFLRFARLMRDFRMRYLEDGGRDFKREPEPAVTCGHTPDRDR